MKRHVFALLTAAFSIAGTAAQAKVHEIRILREGYFPQRPICHPLIRSNSSTQQAMAPASARKTAIR